MPFIQAEERKWLSNFFTVQIKLNLSKCFVLNNLEAHSYYWVPQLKPNNSIIILSRYPKEVWTRRFFGALRDASHMVAPKSVRHFYFLWLHCPAISATLQVRWYCICCWLVSCPRKSLQDASPFFVLCYCFTCTGSLLWNQELINPSDSKQPSLVIKMHNGKQLSTWIY